MGIKRLDPGSVASRTFKVFKEWSFLESNDAVKSNPAKSLVLQGLDEILPDSSSDGGINHGILYRSIRQLYYQTGSHGIGFASRLGTTDEKADFRYLSTGSGEGATVLLIKNRYVGDEIKPGSVTITDSSQTPDTYTFTDDSRGNLVLSGNWFDVLSFESASIFPASGSMLVQDGAGNLHSLVLQFTQSEIDAGVISIHDPTSSVLTDYTFNFLDTGSSTTKGTIDFITTYPLEPSPYYVGNVFYQHGIITLTKQFFVDQGVFLGSGGTGYETTFKSTAVITENEVLCTVNENEFNFSTNPTSAVNGTYLGDFYSASLSSSMDPTGSYLSPFITTVGLYDEDLNLVAVGKLAKPVKSLPDFPVNILVRFDT